MKFQRFGVSRRLRAALRSTTALTMVAAPLMLGGAAYGQTVVNTDTTFTAPADGPFLGIRVINNAVLNGNGLVIGPGSPNAIGLLVESGAGHLVGGSIVQSGVNTVAGIRVNLLGVSAIDSATGSNLRIEVDSTGSSFGDPSAAIYAYGGTIRIWDSTLAATGTNTYGLLASGNTGNFATIFSTNNNITTDGMFGLGAFAFSQADGTGKGVIHIDGGTIATKGLYAYGLLSQEANSEINVTNGASISTEGVWAIGAYAVSGKISIADSAVATSGDSGVGAYAFDNALIEISNSSVKTTGPNANGVIADWNSRINLGNSSVETSGDNAFGAYAYDNSIVQIDNSNLKTTGLGASGVAAEFNSRINVNRSAIVTSGDGSFGASAFDNSIVQIDNSSLTTAGAGAFGVFAIADSQASVSNSVVATGGIFAFGAYAIFGSAVQIDNSNLATTGFAAVGVVADINSQARVNNSAIATSGDFALGAYAANASLVRLENSSLKTAGANADGAIAVGNSQIEMNRVSLVTQGAGARGLVGIDNGVFLIDNSSINASSWAAAADGGGAPNFFTLTNTTMAGGDGLLNVIGNSVANFQATNSILTGRVLTEAGSQSFVTLLGGTLWNMTADSNVSRLTNDNSTIAFAPGGAFKTLTVDGNYLGNSGIFVLNTQLGGDGSPTDRLVVKGDTAGTSFLRIVNAGGTGAPTTEGIKVVQVDGVSAGQFSLLGNYVFMGQQAVVIGPYAYTLQQNGIANPNDGDWYLRSAMPGGGPILQPGAPLYETMPRVALGMMSLPTLQQRVGNRYWPGSAAQGYGATTERSGYWGRMDGEKIRTGAGFSTSAARVDQNQWRAETGLDLVALQGAGGTFISGLTFHYGQANANIQSIFGVGRNETKGYGFGGTATWYGDGGFYADAQGRVSWLDTDLNSYTLNTRLADGAKGLGYSLGLELGQRMPLTANWSLVPQAQLIFANVNYNNLVDPFGSPVNFGNDDSLLGRFGLALQHDRQWRDRAGNLMRTSFYGIANLYREFLDGTSVSLAGLDLRNEDARTWMGGGLGGSFNMNGDAVSLYGEITAAANVSNGSGDSYRFGGKGGLRARW